MKPSINLKKAYKIIFRSGLTQEEAFSKVAEEFPDSPEVMLFRRFHASLQSGVSRGSEWRKGSVEHGSCRKIGLIAGNGNFPLAFARAAKQKGLQVIAVAHEGETLPELAQLVDGIFWIKVGQLGKLIKIFKEQDVSDVLMAGGIKKTRLFGGAMPDMRGMALLARMIHKKDDSLLRAVAEELESEGITVRESTLYLDNLIAQAGILTKKKPIRRKSSRTSSSAGRWQRRSAGWISARRSS